MTSAAPTLPLSDPRLTILAFDHTHTLLRFPPAATIPTSLLSLLAQPPQPGLLVSITRTAHETSVIIPTSSLTSYAPLAPESEGPYAIFKVRGPMDLTLVGIMPRLSKPLADAGVAIMAESTWDTDFVLVKEDKKDQARRAWEGAGWKVEDGHA